VKVQDCVFSLIALKLTEIKPKEMKRQDSRRSIRGNPVHHRLENFNWVAKWVLSRSEPPLLIAGILMVPGYIYTQELGCIAEFIASLDPEIPYSMLAYHPHYKMTDLAANSRNQALECLDAARQASLRWVRPGNTHPSGETDEAEI
jgi:pyruvate formate lyase activating enzyme